MSLTPKLKSTARKAARETRAVAARVPGPSTNPATNLLIMDVAMRGATLVFGRVIEKALLRARYDPGKAADVVKGRTFVQSMAATGAARVATKSVPGFLLVSGGLLAKAIFDRSFSRRESVRRGERTIAEQAAKARDV
ncbi:MAG TPA: hypothetical protein VEB68_02905 [Croceibacterium sp.]|nr:hypothetical protein [Croceibacterium sp.]